MKSFQAFIAEARSVVSPNTKGVLHELLVGYHLNGRKHMEGYSGASGQSPKQAHDSLKQSITPEEYKQIHHRAKAAADDLKKHVGNVHKVHWTSKDGDLHSSTGIKANQKQDPSDIVVHSKNGNKTKFHGISLKTTDNQYKHLPLSNPGLNATHGGNFLHQKHRESILRKYKDLRKTTNKGERKAWLIKNPEAKENIAKKNSLLLNNIVKHTVKQLQKETTKNLANHIRKHVLHALPTPMQKEGHSHISHTTKGTLESGYKFNNRDPSKDFEKHLRDHKNITVHHNGTNIIFSHQGKPFARHRLKFESLDPIANIKGSGELAGTH
jgi:hypothetical protein